MVISMPKNYDNIERHIVTIKNNSTQKSGSEEYTSRMDETVD